MIKAGLLLSLTLLVLSSVAIGATVTVGVQTDRSEYTEGDTVNWTIYVWASSGDNRGVSLLGVNLDDSTADSLEVPLIQGGEFQDTAYGISAGFMKLFDGTVSPVAPDLADMTVIQLFGSEVYDVGSDGQPDYVPSHVFAKGSYTVSVLGEHVLAGSFNGANYWVDTLGAAMEFETLNSVPATITVVPAILNADINRDWHVDYIDFAIISENWDSSNCDQSAHCNGADINRNGFVNLDDFLVLVDQWLTAGFTPPPDADINGDQYVDSIDLAVMSENWEGIDCGLYEDCNGADVDYDGFVNMGDLMILIDQWMDVKSP